MNDQKAPNPVDNQYPEKDWTKSTYSFTSEEKSKLLSLDTITQIGQVAQVMISNLIQNQCLDRVGVANNPEARIVYDIPQGIFFIFTPRKKEEVKKES